MDRSSMIGAVVGGFLAMLGIRAKKAPSRECWADFTHNSYSYPLRFVLHNPEGGQVQFWLNDRFYVDLPEGRYTDSVDVDWAFAKEWDDLYEARCRVRPGSGAPWEELPMVRVDG